MRHHILLVPVLLGLAACAGSRPSRTEPSVIQQAAPRAMHGRVADHVIIISVDGLRPDAIAKYDAKTIQRLRL